MAATTAWLSQLDSTRLLDHWWPQMAAVITSGMSSFTVIFFSQEELSHLSWNHCWSLHAPHPHVPEASEVTTIEYWLVGRQDEGSAQQIGLELFV